MTKILIADDEKLIRAGIRKILSQALGDEVVILEVKNGIDAYEVCRTELPDVLVTDIRMPGMDGVELMEKVSALSQKPAIIVLSGFDDFSYAKAAVSSGAIAYILKPVDGNELVTSVEKALKNVREEEKQKNEQKLQSIISNGYLATGEDIDVSQFVSGGGIRCVSVFCGEHEDELKDFLADIPHYIIARKRQYVSIVIPEDHLSVFVDAPFLYDCAIGVSENSPSVTELRKLSQQSFTAVLQCFFEGKEKKCGVYHFNQEMSSIDLTEVDASYDKLIAAMDLLAIDDVKKAHNKLLDFDTQPQEMRGAYLNYIHSKICNSLFTRYPKFNTSDTYLYLKGLMIENISQIERIADWKAFVLDYILYLMELLKNQQGRYAYITKAVAYINQHYREDITMATVANYVSMNYTWFSEKFKEQMGINFNDYLKRFRMEQAKRLLEMGTYKVYEVAEKSGFRDVKHFMKSFRELNGMSAGEWARLHSGTN